MLLPVWSPYAKEMNMPFSAPFNLHSEDPRFACSPSRRATELKILDCRVTLLENWTAAMRGPQVILIGEVVFHPATSNYTSPLIFVSSDRRLARTALGWFRLGSPFLPEALTAYSNGDVPGYFVTIDHETISLPVHMAMKFIERRRRRRPDSGSD